jgi:hypothetical protein
VIEWLRRMFGLDGHRAALLQRELLHERLAHDSALASKSLALAEMRRLERLARDSR